RGGVAARRTRGAIARAGCAPVGDDNPGHTEAQGGRIGDRIVENEDRGGISTAAAGRTGAAPAAAPDRRFIQIELETLGDAGNRVVEEAVPARAAIGGTNPGENEAA